MKRFVILLTVITLCVSAAIFAEETVLIDFSTLEADYTPPDGDNPTENEATLVDFSQKAGTGFSEEEKALMKTSLALDNWEVVLASSSRTVYNQANSMAKEVPVREDAKKFAGDKVLGIRVHFPTNDYNSWAMVRPPFEIPVYMKKTELDGEELRTVEDDVNRTKFDSYGVIKNVGVIKQVSMNVLGLNFPMGCEIILKDQNNKEMALDMGYLYFDGWRTLTWENPNYITQVRNREVRRFPLYPRATPSIKLVGIRFRRDKEQEGGDFITYVKDIVVTYDKAVLDLDTDINNEEVWGILGDREESRRTSEFEKLGELQVLRALEQKKMHQVSDDGLEEDDSAATTE